MEDPVASPLLASPPRLGRRSRALSPNSTSPLRPGGELGLSRQRAAPGADSPDWDAFVRQDSPPVPRLGARPAAEAATPPRAPPPAPLDRLSHGTSQSPSPRPTASESPTRPAASESPQLTALRRRLAEAVARAQQSGGSLDDALAAPAMAQHGGRPLWEDAATDVGSRADGGGAEGVGENVSASAEVRRQRREADGKVEEGRALSSAFEDLSMDGGSLRSSLTRDSPEHTQQSDVFCNPLWND